MSLHTWLVLLAANSPRRFHKIHLLPLEPFVTVDAWLL